MTVQTNAPEVTRPPPKCRNCDLSHTSIDKVCKNVPIKLQFKNKTYAEATFNVKNAKVKTMKFQTFNKTTEKPNINAKSTPPPPPPLLNIWMNLKTLLMKFLKT